MCCCNTSPVSIALKGTKSATADPSRCVAECGGKVDATQGAACVEEAAALVRDEDVGVLRGRCP